MKMKVYAFFLLFLSQYAWSQTSQITGHVTDSDTNEPLPGVNILVKDTNRGTVSDIDGAFSIMASAQDVLVVSFVGYVTQEITVGNVSTVSIALPPDIQMLGEVVVVGYGTQEKKDITGAIAVVDNKEFESRPNTQLSSLLQGKAAGVQVLSSSGKPSAGLSIRIRGINSITAGSEPLYVVDGVPMSDTRTLNPADIESVSILKDASSAAIYGAQGANGVVIITTKRGTSDTPQFQLDTYYGFSSVWNTLPVLNSEQYRDLMTELGYSTNWDQYTENTDWQNKIFQKGTSQNYQLSLSGKSDKTSYYLSGGWMQQEGAVRSSEMDRYSFKINLEQEVNSWLKVGTNLAYTKYHDVDVNDNQAVNQGGVLLGVLSTPPLIGTYNPDGTFTSNPFQNWENPLASTDGSDRGYDNQRVLGKIYAEITFLKDFKFRSNLGIDFSNAKYDYFLDPFRTSYGIALKGIGQYQTWLTNYQIIDNTLTYDKTIGKHKFSIMVGAVAQKYKWENSSMERRNFASAQIPTPNGGSELISATATKEEKSNASFISRITYNYSDKYLFTANFRADGSSDFGSNKRWGYFPSFSVGWRISEEEFMQNMNFISGLKLRVGYGFVGNDQIENYAYLGKVGSGGNYPIGGVVMPGTYPSSIENDRLHWEASEQTNIGLDFSTWDGRIGLSVDAYIKKTHDILLDAPLPKSTGFDKAVQNIGNLRNKGLEFEVSSQNFVSDFTWETDLNLTINRNEVIDIVGQEIYGGGVAGRGDASLVREGLPLGVFYGYVSGGVDPETGNLYYIDQNGESTFEPSADDRRIIGNANPDFLFGMTNTFSYKGVGISIFLQGSQGNDIFNATRIETEGMIDPKNQSRDVINRWREAGDITDIPKAVFGNTDNSRISTRFVEDGSYLRVKAATLSYSLPINLIQRIGLENVKVYATGENLLTFTDYKGFDPEVNAFGGSNTALGVDYGTYPQTRNIIFGLNVTF